MQTPLADWYTRFPDPSINPTTGEGGWLQCDFKGVEMADKEYDELHVMHGLIRITFDQTDMTQRCPGDPTKKGFPFFLVHLESGEHQTLTPVMRGSGYFTIPHVRMGYKHGVKIQLWEGEYTKNSMEPFPAS